MSGAERWLSQPNPIRLRDGYHLCCSADGTWYLYGPQDRLTRLRAQAEQIGRLAGLLSSPRPLNALLDALDRQGLLTIVEPQQPQVRADLESHQVVVLGANPVAAQLKQLLRSAGVGLVVNNGDLDLQEGIGLREGIDLLVDCAGWLPDGRWRLLDQWCARRRMPWHRCFAEGGKF